MINLVNDFTIVDNYGSASEFKEDDLAFLELSGRGSYYMQGYYGEDIIVAVIDTGVFPHEDFEDRLLKGYNTNRDYKDRYDTMDDYGHGTHCAGSIAGKLTGIAPKAKILPIKVLNANGGVGRTSYITDAIKYATKWEGPRGEKVDIISMSLSGTKSILGESTVEAMEDAINEAVKNDIAVFCSMGNSDKYEKRYPAAYDEVIAVGAVDQEKNQAYFTTTGHHMDVTQVGVGVISTYLNGTYVKMNGTSMSTPITAGIAALIACKYKKLFNKRIPERILYEAVRMNTRCIGTEDNFGKLFGAGFCTLQPIDTTINLTIGDPNMYIDGKPVEVDAPPIINNGRFYVPLRHIVELLGGYVDYDGTTKKATFKF